MCTFIHTNEVLLDRICLFIKLDDFECNFRSQHYISPLETMQFLLHDVLRQELSSHSSNWQLTSLRLLLQQRSIWLHFHCKVVLDSHTRNQPTTIRPLIFARLNFFYKNTSRDRALHNNCYNFTRDFVKKR